MSILPDTSELLAAAERRPSSRRARGGAFALAEGFAFGCWAVESTNGFTFALMTSTVSFSATSTFTRHANFSKSALLSVGSPPRGPMSSRTACACQTLLFCFLGILSHFFQGFCTNLSCHIPFEERAAKEALEGLDLPGMLPPSPLGCEWLRSPMQAERLVAVKARL